MKKKPKVLIVHNYYQIPGGEDTVVANEKQMLEENGHEIILYTRHNEEIKNRKSLGKVKLFFESIFSIKTYREVKKVIKQEKIDIVHVHNTLPLVSPSVYCAAFSEKVPVVQTIHNFRLLCPGATFTRNGKICEECVNKGLNNALKHKCYRNSFVQTLSVVTILKIHRMLDTYNKVNGYIALTEFNKRKLMGLVKDQNKIFVKPNFVKSQVTLEQVKNRKIENYFVFLGRLDKLKGIDMIVECWKEIKDAELLVIGDGPLKEKLEKYIYDNNIENVRILGFMERERAFEILKKAKAMIMASQWYEGFPMTVVESFSLGVPIIASDIGALSEIVNDRNGIKFKYDSTDELVDAILKLNLNDEEVMEFGIQGWYSVNSKYSYDDNYKNMISIYQQVISNLK